MACGDAVGIEGLVHQHDGARAEMVKQCGGDLPVMRLPCRQSEPDREALRVDNDMDLGREPARVIDRDNDLHPFFAVAASCFARSRRVAFDPSPEAAGRPDSADHVCRAQHLIKDDRLFRSAT